MTEKSQFTFNNLERQFKQLLGAGYICTTCAGYVELKKAGLPPLTWVNRVDIDISITKAGRLCEIFNKLGIKGTFFVRLHAKEYNPFSFENYRVLKSIRDSGHEIGYHSEIMDQAAIWGEDSETCLVRDIRILGDMLGIQVLGVSSHGGMTGLNNLDFWKERKPREFGLLYEGYDTQPNYDLFSKSLYVSDSEWTQWKCYDQGQLRDGDRRSLGEHSLDPPPILHSLIHPETYFDKHFYE